jgi:hypothetical protein
MACTLTVFDTESRAKNTYVCDEDQTARIIEDEHAAAGRGQYTDTGGQSFDVDWTRQRLIRFNREGKAPPS